MKITLESTTKIVDLVVAGCHVPARIWEGHTENGIPCFAFITRIAPAIPEAELTADQDAEFQRDLNEQRAPSPAVEAIPLRLILWWTTSSGFVWERRWRSGSAPWWRC